MIASHHPTDDHHQLSSVAIQLSEERKKAQALVKTAREAVETAKNMIARTHQAFAHSREIFKAKGEILQYNRPRREHKAEHTALPPVTPPRPGIDILLIEDSLADATLLRHVLKDCGLPCQLTVLGQRSDVEAFVTQAATAEQPSPPRLIIADCLIPGMEAEDIVAAVRTVPAYQHVPVLLFSSLPEAEGQRRCVQCGATAFVHKPGELQAFVEAVSTMVRQWGGVGEGLDSPSTQEERRAEEGDSSEPNVDK